MEEKTTLIKEQGYSTEELGYYVATETMEQIRSGRDKVLKSNLDRVICIDGREGEGGKSTLAFQLAYAYDRSFCLDRVVFSSKDFENALRTAEKGQAIVWDESFVGLSSKGSLSKVNKRLVQLLMEVRQRNLFIFIVLPSFFMLEKYVAIFRSQALFHCYCSKESVNRRYYKIYNYNNKKLLYIFGKALMSYYKPKVPYSYRFYAKFPPTIDRVEYEQKKKTAFLDISEDNTSPYTKHVKQRDIAWWLLTKVHGVKQKELQQIYKQYGMSIDPSTICVAMRTVTEKMKNDD